MARGGVHIQGERTDAPFSLTDPGTAGQVLTSNGAGADPTFQNPTGSYNDEQAQDAVGTILTDTATIDFTYNDGTPSITADVKSASITEAMQVLADNTTQNVSTTKHGYAPKLPNDATKYLDGTGAYTVPAGGSASDSFKTIQVSGQSDVVADSSTDTLTLVAGTNITLTTNAGTDTITIAATGGGGSGAMTLVEAKTITSDAQSYTFSGLDGDTDGTYLLICEIINGGTGTSLYSWQPNGDTSNQNAERFYADNAATAAANLTTLEFAFTALSTQVLATVTISARKVANSVARTRHYTAQFTSFGASTVTTGHYGGRWNETSTNITSIVVTGDRSDSLKNGSQLYLYKYAQS